MSIRRESVQWTNVSERVYYLDWLRVITVLLLVPFHSALLYIPGYNWWITSDQKNLATQAFTAILDQYHMPLLFLIAGAATCFSLRKRNWSEYLRERASRLLVPAVFGALTFVALNHYLSQRHYFYRDPLEIILARAGDASVFGPFPEHYPTIVLNKLIPFSVEWNPGLLWFVCYLIIYSLALLPVFLFIRARGKSMYSAIGHFFEKRGALILLSVPIAAVSIYPPPPLVNTWLFGTFPLYYYVLFFLYGFVLFSIPGIERILDRTGPVAIASGIAAMTLFMLLSYPSGQTSPLGAVFWPALGSKAGTVGYLLYWTIRSVNCWLWIVGLLYLGKRFLNFTNRFIQYGNEAVLPFYIMHETSIVTISYFVVQQRLGVGAQYAVIVVSALAMTLVLYEIVRRTAPTRLLMGMRISRRISRVETTNAMEV